MGTDSTERQLLADYTRTGSEDAFRALVDRYTPLVYSVCLRKLGRRDLAEDAVQATFLLLAQKAHALGSQVSLGGWLYRTAYHAASWLLREETRRTRRERQALSMQSTRASEPLPPSPELRGLLDDALCTLPEANRDAVVMHYLDGRPFHEVAVLLGCAEDTARFRASRGVHKLRTLLAAQGAAVPVAALVAFLQTEVADAATVPAGLSASVNQAATAPATSGAGSVPQAVASGVQKLWLWAKVKMIATACTCVLAAAAGVAGAASVLRSPGPGNTVTPAAGKTDGGGAPPSVKEAPIAGYGPPQPGTVRLWDLGKAYGKGLNMGFVGWGDRAHWRQIPYGETPETVEHDVALEGASFFFNLTWRPDPYIGGPVLYRKPDPSDPDVPRHNLLYRGWYATQAIWEGGGNLGKIKVLKNTPTELVVQSCGKKGGRDPASTGVLADYAVKAGKPWLEITPVSQCSTIGMHGESRIVILPEGQRDGGDYAYDALTDEAQDKANPLTVVPDHSAKMLLDPVMDDDNLWVLIPTPAEPDSGPDKTMPLEYRRRRFMLSNQVDGYHAGWSQIGEGPCRRIVSAPYAFFMGKKVAIGHLRVGFWHYQKIGAEVQPGTKLTVSWRYVYEHPAKNSPFKTGGTWWPMYAGKWRMVARIAGKCYTTVVAVGKEGVGKTDLPYDPPVAGRLEWVLIYFYERTPETAAEVYAPMDIYREAILGEARQAILGEAPQAALPSAAATPSPAARKPEEPTPAEKAAAEKRYGELRAAIIQAVGAGRKEVVTLDLLGQAVKAKLVAADEKGLTVVPEGLGNQFQRSWSELASRDFCNVARQYSQDHEALYEFCRGKGLAQQAEAELFKR